MMRIAVGVAVAREMLGSSCHALRLDAFDHGAGKLCYRVWVFAKGADTDDGICGLMLTSQMGA